MKKLRFLRIFIESSVFLLIVVSFISIIPRLPFSIAKKTQIVPLSLSLFSQDILVPIVILMALLFMTFLFGRFYCSFLCPLGVIQDIIIGVKKKISNKYIFRYRLPFSLLRYSVFIIFILSIFSGGMYIIGLLDPYSLSGKFITITFIPVIVSINNILSIFFQKFDVYFFSILDYPHVLKVSLIPFVILLTILVIFSCKYGRLFCNSICPVGTFLSFISRNPVFSIDIDKEGCITCGECAEVCKAECIDIDNFYINQSSCIRCFDCVSTCPVYAVSFEPWRMKSTCWKKDIQSENYSRREFITYSAFALVAGGFSSILGRLNLYESDGPPVPPGAMNPERYIERCSSCYLCVNNCPTGVLQPSLFNYGIEGAFIPYMDFNTAFCQYECTVCSNVCPTGALIPLLEEEKKKLQIGRAKLRKDICVVFSEESDCGACAEHCPTDAVSMVPYRNKLMKPVTDNTICVGCGACEYACPTEPLKAIIVEAIPEQKFIEKEICPVEKRERVKEEEEDFPF